MDLLLTDQPLVVYNHNDNKPKKDKKGKIENVKSNDVDVLEAVARFQSKHGVDGDGSVKVDFGKVFGKKVEKNE